MHVKPQTATDIIRAIRDKNLSSLSPDDVLAHAARGVFGADDIQSLLRDPRAEAFAILALTSWCLADWDDDEIFVGEGLSFDNPVFNSFNRGLPSEIKEAIWAVCRALYHDTSQPPEVRSLAWHISRHEFPSAYTIISEQLHRKRVQHNPDAKLPVLDNGYYTSQIQFIMDSALEPSWRRHVLYDNSPGTVIYLNYPGPATVLYIEFGYRSVVGGPHRDRMQEILEEIYPRVETSLLHAAAPHPVNVAVSPFTAEEDQFFRQVVLGRLCKITFPRGRGGYPIASNPEALVPFAQAIAIRASTDITRGAAARLLELSQAQLRKANENWFARTYPAASESVRRHRYERALARFVLPVTLGVGLMAGVLNTLLPQEISYLAWFSLIAPVLAIPYARERGRYIDFQHPSARSLVISLLLGLVFGVSAMLTSAFLDPVSTGHPVFWINAVLWTAVCSFACFLPIRYRTKFQLKPSAMLPELTGLPWDLGDSVKDAIDDPWMRQRQDR